MQDVTIVIPTFNGLELLKNCLRSIENQLFRPVTVMVVDNGSSDGTGMWINLHYPKVQLIRFQVNKGFGAAVNAGILKSKSRYIFLLNNDTEMDVSCLSELMAAAKVNEAYDSFAPKMIQYYNRKILDGTGDGVFRVGAGYRLGTGETDSPLWDFSRPVFGACAGAALYRRSFFEKAGLFDEDYFAYLEDVDINMRAARLGLQCLYVPSAKVFHMGSRTSGGRLNFLTVGRTTQNMFRVVIQNYPASQLARHWPGILMQHMGWMLLMLMRRQLTAYFNGIRSAMVALPEMVKKRKQWNGRKTIPDALFWEKVRRSETDIWASLLRRGVFKGRLEPLVRQFLKKGDNRIPTDCPEPAEW